MPPVSQHQGQACLIQGSLGDREVSGAWIDHTQRQVGWLKKSGELTNLNEKKTNDHFANLFFPSLCVEL